MSEDFEHLLELSDLYIVSQQFEEAIKVLKKAEKIDKMSAKLFYNFGIAYEGLSEKENAREAFRLALKLKPDFVSAQEHLDKLIEE